MNISNALLIKSSLINQGVKFKKRFLNSFFLNVHSERNARHNIQYK